MIVPLDPIWQSLEVPPEHSSKGTCSWPRSDKALLPGCCGSPVSGHACSESWCCGSSGPAPWQRLAPRQLACLTTSPAQHCASSGCQAPAQPAQRSCSLKLPPTPAPLLIMLGQSMPHAPVQHQLRACYPAEYEPLRAAYAACTCFPSLWSLQQITRSQLASPP